MHCRYCRLCQGCLRIPRGSKFPERCPRCHATKSFFGIPLAGVGDYAGVGNYDPVTALGIAWRMAKSEEDFGMAASPEWFEEDDFP